MPGTFARFLAQRRGGVAILVAAAVVPLLMLAAGAIDIGNVYASRRGLQNATDLAAIAAASNLPSALSAAQANAAANGFAAGDVASVTPGIYTADPAIASAARFVPSDVSVANAAKVTMTRQVPLLLGSFLGYAGPNGAVAVTTTATASAVRAAAFSIGSTLISFSGGILNALLGPVFHTGVSLSAVGYQGLATADVDLFAFARSISAQVGVPGATYGQIAGLTVSTTQFINALGSSAPPGVAQSIANSLGSASASGSIPLGQLMNFGPYSNWSVSVPEPQVSASISVLSLLQATAQLGGGHLINLPLSLNLPGVSITTQVTVGEPAQSSGVFAIGKQGTSVHTAQIRIAFDMKVLAGLIDVPLYVEVASGTAQLNSLTCVPLDQSRSQVTLGVTAGLASAYLGNLDTNGMTDFTIEPAVSPASLAPGLQASASATVASPMVSVAFSGADIAAGTVKTVSTNDLIGSLLSSILGNLQVTVLGFAVVPSSLLSAIAPVVAALVSPLDALLDSILGSLGVTLGDASVQVSGVACRAAALVR